ETMARLHRALHNGPRFQGVFCPFSAVDSYTNIARERGAELPHDLAGVHRIRSEIAQALYSVNHLVTRPIHSDLLNENFLLSGNRTWLLDWEYSGMGDVSFD